MNNNKSTLLNLYYKSFYFYKILLLILSLSFHSCSLDRNQDPLIIPPNFNEMPDLNDSEEENDQSKDIQELRDLLLK